MFHVKHFYWEEKENQLKIKCKLIKNNVSRETFE